jgi:hypothetical protein
VVRVGSVLLYRYDFGDDWEHDVRVDRADAGGDTTIRCTGARVPARPRIAEGHPATNTCSRYWLTPSTRSTPR